MSFLDQQLTAFTQTTAAYEQPPVGEHVDIEVQSSNWVPVGIDAYVEHGGYYTIERVLDVNRVRIINVGGEGCVSPGNTVPATSRVIAVGQGGNGSGDGGSGEPLNRTYYVDAAASGPPNGSILSPFTTIQAAISAATSLSLTAIQIYVARGVYSTPFTSPAGMDVQIEGLATEDYSSLFPTATSPVRLTGAITHANTAPNSVLMIAKCGIEADITYTGTQEALLRLLSSPIKGNDIKNGNGGTDTQYHIEASALGYAYLRGYDTRGNVYLNQVTILPGATKYDVGMYYASDTNFGVGSAGTFPTFNTFGEQSIFSGLCSFRNITFNGAYRSFVWHFSHESSRQFHRGSRITYTTSNVVSGPYVVLLDTISPQEYPYLGSGVGGSPFPTGTAVSISFSTVGSAFFGNWALLVNANTVLTFVDVPQFSQWVKIRFVQDGVGGRTVQLPTMEWRGNRVGRMDQRPNKETILWVLWNSAFQKWEDAHLAASASITTPTPAAFDGTEYSSSEITNLSSVAGSTATDALNTLNTAVGSLVTGVSSVYGRTGAVVALADDYNSTKISNISNVAGSTVSDALDNTRTKYSSTRSVASTTLTLADLKRLIRVTGAATITVPTNASVAFPYGAEIDILTETTGAITFTAAGGVTVHVPSAYVNTIQWAKYRLVYLGTDEWLLTQETAGDRVLSIVNADVDAAAAIAGTKIAPDFGSQTVKTTGIVQSMQIGDGTVGGPMTFNVNPSGSPSYLFKLSNGSPLLELDSNFASYYADNYFGVGAAVETKLTLGVSSTTTGTLPGLRIKSRDGGGTGTYKAGPLVLAAGSASASAAAGGDITLFPGVAPDPTAIGNVAIGDSPASYQAMARGIFIADVQNVPTGNPVGGGFLYVQAGALKYRGSSGTVTTLGEA